MTSIDLPARANATVFRMPFVPALARLWAALRDGLRNVGNSDPVLGLNDHLLRDVGVSRADREYRVLFWRVWRPDFARHNDG